MTSKWTSVVHAEMMQHTIGDVRRDRMPFATAAKQFNVIQNTKKRRVLEKNHGVPEEKKILGKSVYFLVGNGTL